MRARLGETDRALRLLDGIDDPAHAWGEVLRGDLPDTVLDRLLAAARGDLSEGQFLLLCARLVGGFLWDFASETEATQAIVAAEVVLAAVDPADELAVGICSELARVGDKAGDDALRRQALDCAGQAALLARDAGLLLDAARLWFAYDAARP